MEFEQYYPEQWKCVSTPAAGSENTSSGCFDCNICLDFAEEPVVTLCGHLYCWPCIYKWLHIQGASPQCPVCKADISDTTVLPLYGRGQAPTKPDLKDETPCQDIAIPPRPSAFETQALVSHASHTRQQLPYSRYPIASRSPLVSFEGNTVHHPFLGMFGELVYARVFGGSEIVDANPNSYYVTGSNNNRLRRQEMQANKSLSRVLFFLFCCFLLCLIVF